MQLRFEIHARSGALRLAAALAVLACAGCESYAPLPLDPHPRLEPGLAALRNETAVDLSGPLDADAVARLAIQNNPDLVAARADRGVARAEMLQAGLLPNPQVSGSYGFLRAGPGTTDQWTAGLGEDIRALILFSSVRRGAELAAAQTDADILWREWQTVGKARLLAIDAIHQDRIAGLLREAKSLLAGRYALDRRAVDEGNLTLAAIAPDLAALADIDKQLADADQKARSNHRDLAVLLGLEPSAAVPLAADLAIPDIDPAEVERLLPDLASRRPDLVALRLGYGVQDEKFRAAIWGQFPALILGGSGGHDTSAVYSIGPTITMDLPIFNHNQGNIAIERATREKLRAEYENRLTADSAEILGLLADQALLRRQLISARAAAAEAGRAADAANTAYVASLIDSRAYVDLVAAALGRRQEVAAIEQGILEQQAALATLTGIGMTVVQPDSDTVGVTKP
jgi:outer membrane protein TolC